jgi:hypothetical protein
MRLAVGCDGAVVVTRPWGMAESAIEKFITEKARWIISKIDYFKQFDFRLIKTSRREYLAGKDNALKFVEEKISYFNNFYGFKFNRINIKNQKTRWGSCSKKGNLNFNYKISLLPERLTDYVVVHEICHLKEFNHSRNFWNLVGRTIPNYLEIRKDLRQATKK